MLKEETIQALLKVDTKNPNDNRMLRIMSCSNPIKDLYVYHLSEVRESLNKYPNKFEDMLVLCIYKFDCDVYDYLEGNRPDIYTKTCAVKLDKELIKGAVNELYMLFSLIAEAISSGVIDHKTVCDIAEYKMPNYIAILQLCGLIDINDDVYRSKILSRFHNIKDEIISYRDMRMDKDKLLEEFRHHLEFFSEQLDYIKKYNMYGEDFLVYTIMFDIRHYKHNRNQNKVLKRKQERQSIW